MKFRKLTGIGFIAFGAANILDFFSPIPIPTVGVSAFLVGGLCIAAGAILIGPEGSWRERLRALVSAEASKSARERRLAAREEARHADPLAPVKVLKLAEARGGVLTVSSVAMALEMGLDDAEAALEELVRKGAASAEVDLSTGVTSWRFPEFLPRSSSLPPAGE